MVTVIKISKTNMFYDIIIINCKTNHCFVRHAYNILRFDKVEDLIFREKYLTIRRFTVIREGVALEAQRLKQRCLGTMV